MTFFGLIAGSSGWTVEKQRLLSQAVAVFSFLVLSATTIFVSGFLRPLADDYCAGAAVTQFGWGAVPWVGETWSGDYVTSVFVTVLLSFPLASQPIFLGSGFAFVASAIAVGVLAAKALGLRNFVSQMVAALVVFVGWFSAFWVEAIVLQSSESRVLA